jgi:hypothetical protein
VGQVAGESVSGEPPDDDLFARIGHGNSSYGAIVARGKGYVTKKVQTI